MCLAIITTIPVINKTHEDLFLEQHTPIAQIEITYNEMEIYHCGIQMSEYKEAKQWQCNSTDTTKRPDFINSDEAMSEEEKEEAFMDYMKYGYHHPSMTKEVENHAALTELYLKSTKPIKEEEFESQFDIKHLTPHDRQEAINIFKRNKSAFSRHACDLGKANNLEMTIPLTTTEPHIQKYIPIPHTVRDQVKLILDQMEEYGIIRECNEPSIFCSNLLVTKKKDKKNIRILLDGRLINNYTRRLPTNLVTHSELYAHLVGKKNVTTIDLSDAFFQIPLATESQPLTAFYSPSHGKRYCFQRVAQGLRNSPLYLKLLMDKLFGDMASDVIHYADDIMLATNGSMKDHLHKLSRVLAKLKEGNIKIRPTKINVARETIEFLGVVWTKDKISIPEAKTLAFKKLPSPNTP